MENRMAKRETTRTLQIDPRAKPNASTATQSVSSGGGTGKVRGQVLADYEGLTISVDHHKAKGGGKDRVLIQIRQNGPTKRWRTASSLSYARSADIEFENEPSGKDWAKKD
jgi:hypothetical protein